MELTREKRIKQILFLKNSMTLIPKYSKHKRVKTTINVKKDHNFMFFLIVERILFGKSK